MDASAIRFPNGFNVDSAIQEVNKRKRVLIESNGNDAVIIPVKVGFTSQIINFGLSNYFWKKFLREITVILTYFGPNERLNFGA
jgi:hypothetical protein